MTRSLFLLAFLAPALSAEGTPSPRLVEGKFGKALDALVTPLAFTGDTRYRTPPLTVECWATIVTAMLRFRSPLWRARRGVTTPRRGAGARWSS